MPNPNVNYIYFDIPVKPYIAKYILKVYGNCIMISRRNSVALLLYYLLQKNEIDKQYDYDIQFYTHTIKVSVSDKFSFRRGARYLSSFSIVQFNTFVEDLFKSEFHRFVDISRLYGNTIMGAIENFQKEYALLETDISTDALRRSYFRYAEDKNKEKEI